MNFDRGNRLFGPHKEYDVYWVHIETGQVHVSTHGWPNRVQWSEQMEMLGWMEIYQTRPRWKKDVIRMKLSKAEFKDFKGYPTYQPSDAA